MKSINKEEFHDACEESGKPHFLDNNYYNSNPQKSAENNQTDHQKDIEAQNTISDSFMIGRSMKCNTNNKIEDLSPPTSDLMLNSSNSNEIETNLGPKVECVYSLLGMLGQNKNNEMAEKFFELSKNRETCLALRKSGCISILVQLLHSDDTNETMRKNAGAALHNIVHCHHNDDKNGRREIRVLKLIEQLLDFCDILKKYLNAEAHEIPESHPIVSIGTLMKISFDEDHRHAMCSLGALQTISNLVQLDHDAHGSEPKDINCITLRRYAGMTLTNLTFGDGNNKTLLCSNKKFMKSFVQQIDSSSDELVQVTASVLRNLSWRADANVKQILSEINTVKILTKAAMQCVQENTLKSILSALWNLSNHCSANKAAFCECDGAISFLIRMLQYDSPNKTLAIVENAGGILRNISSHIAIKEEYRQILRRQNCLGILLQQLKSPSLTIVSNASGTLGNLSSNCPEDQKFLRDNSAIPMLRSLIYSKHKMISTGSTIALRNLLNFQKTGLIDQSSDSISKSMDLKELPSLNVRKQRAFQQDFIKNLSNNCVSTLPTSMGFTKRKTQKSNASNDRINESIDININKSISNNEKQLYQETDLDQPVNFSIRYAEHVIGLEEEQCISIDEDYVQTYFTEGTPKYTSISGSVSDLRNIEHTKSYLKAARKPEPFKLRNNTSTLKKLTPVNSGMFTPEKPINYCEEGTPTRCDSLSNLSEVQEISVKLHESSNLTTENTVKLSNNVENGSLLETPLIFSRNSSTDSLNSAGSVCIVDDKSSVVSDFSRLASGTISPSDLPDSPIQDVLFNIAIRAPENFEACKSSIDIDDATKIQNNSYVNNITSQASIESKQENVMDDDNYILEQTISIGIQSSTIRLPGIGIDLDDLPKEYLTEDTPIPLSKVGSSCNLSNLSMETVNENEKFESSHEDQILEAIVQKGIESTYNKSRQTIGNSFKRLRDDGKVDYLSVCDEINPIDIEGTRASFTATSELSAITINSELFNFVNYETVDRRPIDESSKRNTKNESCDTVSSISSDSVDDDRFLNQAIIAGTQKLVSNLDNSYSSIDSCDDQTNHSLLEQIVQSGMKKVMSQENEFYNENEQDVDLLLEEVIRTGINKTTGSSNKNHQISNRLIEKNNAGNMWKVQNTYDLKKVSKISKPGSYISEDNTKHDIQFKVGQKVSTAESNNKFCSSLMNSNLIMEATKFAVELENYSSKDLLISCDLNNVQPPSDLDCLSLSTTSYDVPTDSNNQMCRTTSTLKNIGVDKSNDIHSASIDYTIIDNINHPSVMNEVMGSHISIESMTSDTQTMTISNTNLNECINESTESSSIHNSRLNRRRLSERFKTYTITNDAINLLQTCNIDQKQTNKISKQNGNGKMSKVKTIYSKSCHVKTSNLYMKDRVKTYGQKDMITCQPTNHNDQTNKSRTTGKFKRLRPSYCCAGNSQTKG
ncbi:serine-rich adhesin for platelets-like isoform X2 [Culicoides brevitarsis]|uniref:serine-rich adhesin for platelets-like isoform X2 n=1 Tax=Culicoides brevitarsis TaxID=469753 RepID=UPI00307B63F6